MGLQQQIADDLKAAMKRRDREAMATLRLLVAGMKNAAVEQGRGPQGELDDQEVTRLLTTERKRREEAAAAFDEGDRPEQAAKERSEAELIAGYLPTQLDDGELRRIVDGVVEEVGADAGMGPLMKASMARVGDRADGKRVQAAVRDATS